jgi:hypothetical protein
MAAYWFLMIFCVRMSPNQGVEDVALPAVEDVAFPFQRDDDINPLTILLSRKLWRRIYK